MSTNGGIWSRSAVNTIISCVDRIIYMWYSVSSLVTKTIIIQKFRMCTLYLDEIDHRALGLAGISLSQYNFDSNQT